jgi:hypothetical protein
LLLASLFGSVQRSYLSGAAKGWAGTSARTGIAIGNFNALRELNASDSKAAVSLGDLKSLEAQLREFGPDALRKFKRDARRIGKPAQDELRKAFRQVGIAGPLGAPKRPGRRFDRMYTDDHARLSYAKSYSTISSSRSIDINYKNRTEGRALARLKAAGDGTISIVRLLVKSPALIVADMAGKSRTAIKRSGQLRPFKQNLFGRGVIDATPAMRAVTPRRGEARDKWLKALDQRAAAKKQSNASRYAWPTMENYMSIHKLKVSMLLNDVIAETNKKLGN